jgi:ubiquinone/menaquinone biosynthesis C-methylase UbiE
MEAVVILTAVVIAVAAIGIFLYWQLAVAEGAYLGRRVVALLYDWFAPRYDRVKDFDPASDAVMLALPIMQHLARQPREMRESAALLDVATGTGRLPHTLLTQTRFRGRVVALDLSSRMLARAQAKLAAHADRITWLQHDAQQLPFDDGAFEVVTCLEALEFFPQPMQAVREMARVLKRGGLLMVSNRIGPDAWKLPGRALPTPGFAEQLRATGLTQIEVQRWLVDYDLVLAVKPE